MYVCIYAQVSVVGGIMGDFLLFFFYALKDISQILYNELMIFIIRRSFLKQLCPKAVRWDRAR